MNKIKNIKIFVVIYEILDANRRDISLMSGTRFFGFQDRIRFFEF